MSDTIKLLASSYTLDAPADMVNMYGEVVAKKGDRVVLVPMTTSRAVMHGENSLEDILPHLSTENHNHAAATSSVSGFLSAKDKTKLDTIEQNANAYVLPEASTELGGVRTTSDITDVHDYLPAPIVDGVPYYKVAGDALPAVSAPLGPGTAFTGTSTLYARSDHIHPRDASAPKLDTARSLAVALDSTEEATFDGSANQESIPVNGVLSVEHGGTGATQIADIRAGKDSGGNVIHSTYATKIELANELSSYAKKTEMSGELAEYATRTELNNTLDLYAKKSDMSTSLDALRKGLVQIVSQLPESGTEGVIYLIQNENDTNSYDRYTWENNKFVPLGNTAFSFEDYVRKEATVSNVTIAGRTITITMGNGTTKNITTQDTTYPNASAYEDGILTAADKVKLDSVATDATNVVVTPTLTSGTKIGTITVNGTENNLYCQTNTDTTVTQNVSSDNNTYPILLTPTANASTNQGAQSAIFASGVKINPSTGEVVATKFTGNADTATKDSAGQQITTTYIKGLKVSGKTITYTRGDDTTGTITTQDTTYNVMGGATASAAGTKGLVPESAAGEQAKVLSAAGTWVTNTGDTHWTSHLFAGASGATANAATSNGGTYLSLCDDSTSRNSIKITGSGATTVSSDANGVITINSTNTTYKNMTAATADAAGTAGLVPAPAAGKQGQYLRGDGTWATPTNTTYSAGTGLSLSGTKFSVASTAGTSALAWNSEVTLGTVGGLAIKAKLPANPNTNTWTAMKGATSSADGSVGYVNAVPPKDGYNTKYLRADGTWQVPPNTGDTHWTTHLYVGGSGATANAATSNGGTYLSLCDNSTSRNSIKITGSGATSVTSDANGVITIKSTNTTYSGATTSANGLVTTGGQSWAGKKSFTGGITLYKSNLNMTVNKGSADTTDYEVTVLKALGDNAGYGINLSLCGGGNTIVGGGEAGNSQLSDLKDNSSENLYLVADGSIYFKPNGNKWADVKTVTLDTAAQLSGLAKVTATTFVGALTGNVTGNCSGSSGSCTGNAATATKLATARTIYVSQGDFMGSATFDGSGNINLAGSMYGMIVNVGSTNNYPFHRIAYSPTITGSYKDYSVILLIDRPYNSSGHGICKVVVRTNNVSSSQKASCEVYWLVRDASLAVDSIQVGFVNTSGSTYADIFYKSSGTYMCAQIRVLAGSDGRTNAIGNRGFQLVSSSVEVGGTTTSDPKTSVESYATIAAAGTAIHSKAYTSTIAASDHSVVNSANSCSGNAATATTATKVNGTAGTSALSWNTEVTLYTVGGHAVKAKLPANPNTDTHWTTHLYAGASNGNANAATTNGNTYLIACDNTSARDRRLIKGTGATTVTSDANGVITINSTNTTYSNMTAATADAAGKAGLVPAPAKGAQGKFLRGDGTWQTPTNTTYGNMKGATSSAAGTAGLVPAPAAGKQGQYLRGDGAWATPTNTTYNASSWANMFGANVAVSASDINVANGATFTKTITANTTFTFSGAASGRAATFSLILTNGGSKTVTWPSSVKWAGGSVPSLTASGVDVLTFLTPNGGSTWYGVASSVGAA